MAKLKKFDNEKTREIIKKFKCGEISENRCYSYLYTHYQLFVEALVSRYVKKNQELQPHYEDLTQEAYLGLFYAASKFDLDRQWEDPSGELYYYKFTTYATNWVNLKMRDFSKHIKHPITIGGHILNANTKILYSKDKLYIKDTVLSDDQIEDISNDTGLNPKKIRVAHNTYFPLMSMASCNVSSYDLEYKGTDFYAASDVLIENLHEFQKTCGFTDNLYVRTLLEFLESAYNMEHGDRVEGKVNAKKKLCTQAKEYAKSDNIKRDVKILNSLLVKHNLTRAGLQDFVLRNKLLFEVSDSINLYS